MENFTITVTDLAKICHQANNAYCETMNDFSQPTWSLTERWQRESAVNGVKFHLDNPTAGPEGSHDSWLREKEKNGWVYGPLKDAKRKTHYCMVPFDELPVSQQLKDHLFVAIVDTFRTHIQPLKDFRRRQVKIEYFLGEVSQGIFSCVEASNQAMRDEIARKNQVFYYDKVVLDDGRVVLTRDPHSFVDETGNIWIKLVSTESGCK